MAGEDHARLDESQRDPYPLYARAHRSEGLTFVPELDAWLVARDALIPAAVEEAARFDTAVQGFRRTTTRPVTISGTELPAGATVFVAYGSANRDGARYDRPEVFDVTRPLSRQHMAFGRGAHGCPGSQLAREQLRLTIELFAGRLPDLRLDEGKAPVVMRPTLIHRSPEALHLLW